MQNAVYSKTELNDGYGSGKEWPLLHTRITDVYMTLQPQCAQMLKWYLISERTMVIFESH